ncbi:MAG: hypothetical protein EP343_24985 [Deltaproteobacteria bacterium]|nr:MAG: hypothetical protein EP343_24985 [Deltaproteobacteria bacterium]
MRTRREVPMLLRSLGLCVLWLLLGGSPVWAQTSGMSSNVLVLPTGPGSLGGIGENVQANLNMGMMSYPISILLPQGRQNVQPSIRVVYSSSAGSGMMGIGWSLQAGGSIERLTVRGLPTYTNSDRFYSDTGELVKIPNSPFYRSRYEGSFVRYCWMQKDANDQQGYWVAEYPNGSKAYYGATPAGKVELGSQVYGAQNQTFRWEMVAYVDRNGNRIEYKYVKVGSQTYIDQIAWVFDESNNPLYQVNFTYEDRPDPISDGKPGFDLQTTKRLNELTILAEGKRFRSYSFTFEDQTGLSRLIKVERFGRDPKQRYPVVFTMKYSDATFSPANSKMVEMPTSLGLNFASNNAGFLDINGDGLPDVVNTSNPKHVFHLNELTLKSDLTQDKHNFPKSNLKTNPTETSAKLSSPSVQLMDANGDGFTDLVDAVNKKMYLNKGNTQWEASTLSVQNYPITSVDLDVRFFDYNGDKQIDIIRSDGTSTSYWINEGNGNWKRVVGGQDIGLSFSKDRLRLIDINGDGLMDVVHITTSSLRYKKYLGYGRWTDWISLNVPGIDQYPLSTSAQFADVNGDGMADMVAFLGTSLVYFVNKNGKAFDTGKKLQAFQGIDIPDSTKTSVRIVDINGNGSRDIVWIGSSGKVTYLELFGKRPNLMTEIANGIGQRINVAYGSSVNFYLRDMTCDPAKDKACAGPWQNKMPMAFPVVTQITTWASHSDKPESQATPTGKEAPQTQRVYYHNGFYDGNEKKFRGFRKVESLTLGDQTVPTRIDTMVYDVGDKDPYFHGRMLQTMSTDEAGKLFQESKSEWKDCGAVAGADQGLTPPVRFICQVASETTIKEGETDQAKWKTLRSEMTYDGYGNVTRNANLGEVSLKGDEKYVKTTFIVPTDPKSDKASWTVRLPQTIEYCADPNGACAKASYFYDGTAFEGLPAGQFTKGNLSRVSALVDLQGQKEINLHMRKYDKYGNIIERKRPTGNVRTYTYDKVYNKFPTSETVKVGSVTLTSSAEWDYNLSQIIRSTDPNNLTMTYTYDNFGRRLSMSQPSDPVGKPSTEFTYELKAPISRIITKQRSKSGGEHDRQTIQCFDGLGRKFMLLKQVAAGRFITLQHNNYNSIGQVSQIWNAYENDGTCQFEPNDSKLPFTQFQYDAMQRVVQKTFADGTMTKVVHKPLETHDFDENDNDPKSPFYQTPDIKKMDGQGRLLEMIEASNSKVERKTQYRYNHVNLGLQDKVEAFVYPGNQKKKQSFNLLGYLTKVEHPDGTTTEFTYNEDGQPLERKDRRGRVIVHTYDAIGRPLTIQEKGKPDTLISYKYDTPVQDHADATFTTGQPVQVTYPGGSITNSYSMRGQPVVTRRKVMGVTFEVKRTFNNLGDPLQLVYPDGRTIDYSYDGASRLTAISNLVTSISYGPRGFLSSRTTANKVKTSYNFDARLRLTKMQVESQPGFTFTLQRDPSGNINSWQETWGSTSYTNSYTYDALDRLVQASLEDGKEVLTYGLTTDGNLTQKTSSLSQQSPVHIGDYAYNSKKIHAITSAGPMKLSYDAGGLLTSRDAMKMEWEYRGQLQQVTQNNQVMGRYWYDHNADRVIKAENGVYSFYIYDDFWMKDGDVIIYPRLSGHHIARWSSTAFHAKFYDDLAPATGDAQLTPQPDGQITAADAWLYHASRQKLLNIPTQPRPLDLDLTQNMLQASVSRMLSGGQEEKLYLSTDHLGSIRMVTDATGNVVQTKTYYPYGAVKSQSSPLVTLGYQGTELDQVTKANYFGARYLDTRLGTWLSPDPAFVQTSGPNDEWSRYTSVLHNPIRYRDIDGYASIDAAEVGSIGFGIVTAGYALVHGGYQLFRAVQNQRITGRKNKASRAMTIAGNFAAAGLGAAAAAMTIQGDLQTAMILGYGILAGSMLRSIGSVYHLHRQNIRIKHYNNKNYNRGRHREAVLLRSAGLVVGLVQIAAVATQTDEKTATAMIAATGALALVANFFARIWMKRSHKTSTSGVNLTSDVNLLGDATRNKRAQLYGSQRRASNATTRRKMLQGIRATKSYENKGLRPVRKRSRSRSR